MALLHEAKSSPIVPGVRGLHQPVTTTINLQKNGGKVHQTRLQVLQANLESQIGLPGEATVLHQADQIFEGGKADHLLR